MRQRLENITLRAFKTIKEIEDFSLGPITVLIGPNGAGKSNFISFFRMLSWAVATPGTLQEYIARQGGASALLHDGPGRTRDIEAHLSLKTEAGRNDYAFRLAYASGDTLIYTEEKYRFSRAGLPGPAGWTNLETGHREARLIENAENGDVTARTIHSLLPRLVQYQFHNTSSTARIRQKWTLEDGRWLREDAGHLAPFLLRLKDQQPQYNSDFIPTPLRS